MRQGSATLLVVDSDEDALSGAVETIGSLGYRVARAADAATALAIFHRDLSVGVVLIDVMMAGAADLAAGARRHRPGVQIVYTTGYPEMLLLDREVPGDAPLLRKPIEPERLRAVVTGTGR